MSDSFKKEERDKKLKEVKTPTLDKFVIKKRSRSSPEELGSGNLQKRVRDIKVVHSAEMEANFLEKISEMLDAKLDAKFSVVATKADIKSMEKKFDRIASENQFLCRELVVLKEENKKIKENTEMLVRKLKAKNLVIKGLQEVRQDEDGVKLVQELCVKSLGVNEPMIDRVFSIANGQSLVVEFVKQSDVQNILKNAKKLKGTGIWINRDLPYQDRQKRKKLFEVKKKILEVEKEDRVIIRDNYLLFKNKKFFWDDEKGVTASKEEDLALLSEEIKERIGGLVAASKNCK